MHRIFYQAFERITRQWNAGGSVLEIGAVPFSPQVFETVFFDGMKEVQICTEMLPPRIIGSGIMP